MFFTSRVGWRGRRSGVESRRCPFFRFREAKPRGSIQFRVQQLDLDFRGYRFALDPTRTFGRWSEVCYYDTESSKVNVHQCFSDWMVA